MPRNWEALLSDSDFTPVMRLVHLAFRQTMEHEEAIRATLLRTRREAFEGEMDRLVGNLGCDRKARLTSGPELSDLSSSSADDARGMVNTFNYDLAIAITAVKAVTPRANRNTYAARLNTWDKNRSEWKHEQSSVWATLTATSLAQAAFLSLNTGVVGTARLIGPDPAAEPICQGFLNRGEVPLSVALANPSPFHLNCLHPWDFSLKRIGDTEPDADFCSSLWMGD